MTDTELVATLKQYKRENFIPPNEQCSDPQTLIEYVEGDLDEETKKHMNVHVVFCRDCSENVTMLKNADRDPVLASLNRKLNSGGG